MARKVVWTETAWRDLERSADYIAEDYRLILEVHEKTVYILGLIHGARDLAALWRLEDRSESEKPS
jgi:hypothetical protein